MAMLRKIKQKIKNIVTEKKKTTAAKKHVRKTVKPLSKAASMNPVSNRSVSVPIGEIRGGDKREVSNGVKKDTMVRQKEEREILGSKETFVGKTKFYTPVSPSIMPHLPKELPLGYGEDKIVLMVRDPWWLYTYWEVTQNKWEALKQELGQDFYSAKKILRVYDVSNIIFNGSNAHSFFDIEIGMDVNNWYINTAGPGRSWCVDLGLRLMDGRFITIIRSNVVNTPIDGPSWITDEEWMIPEEMFARLYGMGFGFGRTSPGKAWAESMKRALFSGVLASPGITSVSSPGKKQKGRKFWFVLDCELLVYGATEPDAKVTVQGREIKLRPDGTFTLRFALPDGKQVIPATAVSADNIEEHTITPTVTRETKSSILVKETATELVYK